MCYLLFRSCVVVTGPIGLVRGLATNQKEPKLIDVLAAVAIAMAHPQSPVDDTSTMAVCSYEDGNTDGLPCVWTDPDTALAESATPSV